MKIIQLLPIAALLVACGSARPVAQVHDGVYELPDYEPVASLAPVPEPDPADDYYDPSAAQQLDSRGYYDMTYNDPYYYNYGRFGFGYSAGSWGSSYGMGASYGGCGCGGWNDPYWGNPYGSEWYGSGWCGSGYYGSGYPYPGYGYYGYGGGCYGCYQPVVICGSSNVVVGHRPSTSGGGGGSTGGGDGGGGIPTIIMRDPVSLRPATTERTPAGSIFSTTPTRQGTNDLIQSHQEKPQKGSRTVDGSRGSNQDRPVFHGSDGGSSPSRSTGGGSTGGGSTPSTGHRAR